MPSKHLLRWSWTRTGSLVCDRMCSKSSLERKKKRGNSSCFECKYSFSFFFTLSIVSLQYAKFSNARCWLQASSTRGLAYACDMMMRQILSIDVKVRKTSGSCCWMSGELKIGHR